MEETSKVYTVCIRPNRPYTFKSLAHFVMKPPPFNTPEGLDVSLAFLPFHHSYGLYAFCFRSLLAPNTIVILPKWNIERAIKAIEKCVMMSLLSKPIIYIGNRYRVTRLSMIPSLIHQLVNYPKLQEADLSSLLYIGSGATYLPLKLAERLSAVVPKDLVVSQGMYISILPHLTSRMAETMLA